jgi:hypothetical protein
VDCVLCFQESALYVSISGEHGHLGSLKAISVLCFQDPLFFVTLGLDVALSNISISRKDK